jgi:hypothetical protein
MDRGTLGGASKHPTTRSGELTNIFALLHFNLGAHLLPEICDSVDSVRTLHGTTKRLSVVGISLSGDPHVST